MDNWKQETSENNIPHSPKPFWQSNGFAFLALIIFYPVGLFLMWKYTSWKKWVKIVLTVLFLFWVIPLIMIWTTVLGLMGIGIIDNWLNPTTPNQSTIYNCQPLNREWGKCTHSGRGVSFEYPLSWGYADLRPEGLGFSPHKANTTVDNWVLSFAPYDWDDEAKAREFATRGFLGDRPKIYVNGLEGGRDERHENNEIELFAALFHGKTTYDFNTLGYISLQDLPDLRSVFDHMVSSFKVGR